ncbi:MAG: hypothetical protein ABIL62_19505 [Planctomycetota bacterium]
MSLTSLLKNKDVREKFKQEFPKPKFTEKKELLAPPLTKHWSVVGTAFDYLFRCYLKRLNPKAVERQWVAEESLKVLFMHRNGFTIDLATGEVMVEPPLMPDKADVTMFLKIKHILSEAHNRYQAYLKTGKITKPLLTSAILLANFDIIFRTGRLEYYVEPDTVSDEDIKDLANLIRIIDSNLFKAKKICMLNPTFGEASTLFGGADADIVIDNAIIDIKTTRKLQLTRDYYHQLIGYYTLYKIGGIDSMPAKHKIENLAIYFSRYAYLYVVPVKGHINKVTSSTFLKWFKERAQTP